MTPFDLFAFTGSILFVLALFAVGIYSYIVEKMEMRQSKEYKRKLRKIEL